jgi:hypothetical protein
MMTLRLAKWRNSEAKAFDVWNLVFTSGTVLSPKYFSSCVHMLCDYARSLNQDASGVQRTALMKSITQWSMTEEIPPNGLTALVRVFEHLLIPTPVESFDPTEPCVAHPYSYAVKIREGGKTVRGTHGALTLALVKDLRRCAIQDNPQGRLSKVLGMIWLSPFRKDSKVHARWWNTASTKTKEECSLSDVQEEILQDWILHAEDSRQFKEIVCLLMEVVSTPGNEGLRWLCSGEKHNKDDVFFLLRRFDDLLTGDQEFIAASRILKLLCKVLQARELTYPSRLRTTHGPHLAVSIFKSPFVRTIAYRALEIDTINEGMPKFSLVPSHLLDQTIAYMFWNMSESDPESLWELRARLIRQGSGGQASDAITGVLKEAFNKISALVSDLVRHLYISDKYIAKHRARLCPPDIVFA